MNYIEILGEFFPSVEASCIGDPTDISDIVVADGSVLPSQEEFAAADLQIRQDAKWQEIKTERDRRYYQGVYLDNPDGATGVSYWFWTDIATRAQYSMYDIAIRIQSLPPEQLLDEWKTMSGVFTPMTVRQLYRVITAAMTNEKTLFNLAESKKAAMLLLTNPETYDALVDWPVCYSDTLITPA